MVAALSAGVLAVGSMASTAVAGAPSSIAYLKASEVASGYTHSCAIGAQGYVFCWGQNTYGQLGDGSTADSSSGVLVMPPNGLKVLKGVTSLAVGDSHACVVRSGAVYCWGQNTYGQLARDVETVDHSSTPLQVANEIGGPLTGVTVVAAGYFHTCALTSGGTVWCWGSGGSGELGNGTTPDYTTAVQVVGPSSSGYLTGVTQIAAGGENTCALKGDGTVWCWGLGMYGALGNGEAINSAAPVRVDGSGWAGTKVTRIDVGDYHSCVVTAVGGAWCWGFGDGGELGDGLGASSATPVEVTSGTGSGRLSGVSRITAGYDHTCASLGSGSAWCWGANDRSQLGIGTATAPDSCEYECALRPQQVVGPGGSGSLAGVIRISAGNYHTCAVTSRSAVYCWGPNAYGQLGDGTTTDSGAPVRVRL